MRKESQVTKLINIYLDGLVSVGNDAGWCGDSVLARLGEGGADCPRDQSNTSMIAALEMYREKHYQYTFIERIVHRLLGNQVTALYITALLVDNYYHGVNPMAKDGEGEPSLRAYNEEDKVALWVKHMAEQGIKEPMSLKQDEALRVYRYGVSRAGPRLVRREGRL